MAAQANSVLVLCAGKLVFQGPPAKLLAAEADLVTWQLKTSEADVHNLPRTIRRQPKATTIAGEPVTLLHGEKTSLVIAETSVADGELNVQVVIEPPTKPTTTRVKDAAVIGQPDTGQSNTTTTETHTGISFTQLRLESVSFSYPSFQGPAVPVLKDLNLTLEPGSYTLVSGANGAGKSTLLRLMAGLLEPNQGSITLTTTQSNSQTAAQPLSQSTKITPGQVGLVFQNPEDQLFAATVAEDIAFGPQNLGLLPKKSSKAQRNRSTASLKDLEGHRRATNLDESDPRLVSSSFDSATLSQEELVDWALQSVGLDSPGFAQRSPFTLSGGEMRRVAIAGILAMRPTFLLFDEPTAGLDAVGRAFVHRLILSELNRGTAVLVVSHSLEEFQKQADYQYQLDGGCLWPS
jgi:energy-coupling factor transport system ATP-binding protein